MELNDVRAETSDLSVWAYLATVGPDGRPDVVPVHPAWTDDTLWIMTWAGSVKVGNITANPDVALHWHVNERGDGVELWGAATVHSDVETRRRLWTGVFDYNLDDFAPGGPEAPGTCFVAVEPERAVVVKQFGMGGRHAWRRI